jgi:hypothetical protein
MMNVTNAGFPQYKITPKAPAQAPAAQPAPAPARPTAPAPAQEKSFWQQAAERAAGLIELVAAPGAAFGASIAGGVAFGAKVGLDLAAKGSKMALYGADEAPQAAEAPAPTPAPTPKPKPLAAPASLMAYGNDLKTATDINNFCWHAAKQLLGRKPEWSEINAWREQIQRQGLDKQGTLALIAQHHTAQEREVQAAPMLAAYKEAFGRDMSTEERAFYVGLGLDRQSADDIRQRFADVKSNLEAGIINGDAILDEASALAHQAANPADLSTAEQQLVLDARGLLQAIDTMSPDGRDAMDDPGDQPAA